MPGSERRHPPVPSWAAALDVEQQVEQAAALKAFRYEADLHNAAAEPRAWVFHISVERYPGPHRTPQVAPNRERPRVPRGQPSTSVSERLAARQRVLDTLAHRLEAGREVGLDALVVAARLQQLVDDVERGHHGDAVEADHLPAVADLPHLAVEVLRGVDEGRPFLGRAGDVVFLLDRKSVV